MVIPFEVRGPALAVATCARRLAPIGARPADATSLSPGDGGVRLDWGESGRMAGDPIELDLSWYGPAAMTARRGSEAAVQAMTGLMQVHGRDSDGPRRIGLEVASVAAGILAGHAALATLIARIRGLTVTRVESSVLQAGLLLVSHRLAADSSGHEWVPAPAGPAPGPPFRSADGPWFEIETLDPLAWKAFWERLGAGGADLGWAWKLFRPRYFRGTCTLPPGLHEATRALGLDHITAAAEACNVSLRRVRDYDEIADELGPSDGHPGCRPFGEPHHPRPGAGVPAGLGALPLTGVRVLEATNRMQGPLAGLLLEMLGASVVRVEPPGGDLFRTVPPLLGDTGSFFLSFNRGKEPVELDLATPSGRSDLVDLAAGSDVFLQNWRPGKAAEWRLAAEDLAAANGRLVYAYASGWGGRPALAHLLGTDFLVQAHAGLGAGIRPAGEPPLPSRALFTDYAGALVTCEGVLAGLYAAERTGRGQRVDASLLSGAVALQAHVLEAIASGEEKGRRRGRPVWGPLDHPLPTADGFLVVTVEDDEDVRRLCRVCDVDPSLGEGLDPVIADRIAGQPGAVWEAALAEEGVACAEVCTDLGALPDQPRLNGLFEPLGAGASVPGSPWRVLP
ncbi:MAG TPA: CoA transferase [Egibacteraceae bacterium]|nr:CoA transferase [Egibacteraceae bacterium]